MDDHTLDPNAGDLRRIEVITGTGRRRRWSAETKAPVNGGEPPAFVPMITDGATAPASCGAMAGSAIEIEVAGTIVRVRGRVKADALVEVLAAVKRAR